MLDVYWLLFVLVCCLLLDVCCFCVVSEVRRLAALIVCLVVCMLACLMFVGGGVPVLLSHCRLSNTKKYELVSCVFQIEKRRTLYESIAKRLNG